MLSSKDEKVCPNSQWWWYCPLVGTLGMCAKFWLSPSLGIHRNTRTVELFENLYIFKFSIIMVDEKNSYIII